MLSSNPFALLGEHLPPLLMQIYVILMVLAVVLGTLLDLRHKRSAEFFALRRRKAREAARRCLGSGEIAALALKTLADEVASAGEFDKWPRRLSHLLTSYGFVIYLIATALMVFVYSDGGQTPLVITTAWHVGALMALAGGLWFFVVLRVDVAQEGHSPFRLTRADLFIVTLMLSVAFGLLWHFGQTLDNGSATMILFGLYLFFTTLLFVSVPWSKFAHMFYKPMAAFQTRIEEASGASDLPRPSAGNNIRS